MTAAEAVAALDDIDMPGDPEQAHSMADKILLAAVDPIVRDAYDRCKARTGCWWYA